MIANLLNIQLNGLIGAGRIDVSSLPPDMQGNLTVLTMLGNGFIVTAMIWATWLVWVIDGRMVAAAGLCLVTAALTLVGLIHSPFADGRLFIPDAGTPHLVYALAAGYVLLGALCASLSRAQTVHPRTTTALH